MMFLFGLDFYCYTATGKRIDGIGAVGQWLGLPADKLPAFQA